MSDASWLASLRRTAEAQQHSTSDVHGVSVKPSQLLALIDIAERAGTSTRRSYRLANLLTQRELAYLSRAIFRQRADAPDDEPDLATHLDPLISIAKMHAK